MKNIFVLLLFVLPAAAFAQTMTLEQAVESAVANHPRLHAADASIERSRAARGESWEIAPTSFEYAWGQLNGTERKDSQITLSQSVGSLLTPFYKNALANKQIATGTYHRELVQREVAAEVKRAWAYYLYTSEVRNLYRHQNILAEQFLKINEQRFAKDKISVLERNMTATLAAEARTKLFLAQEELGLAALRLQWACCSETPFIPADTVQVYFETDTLDDDPHGEAYRDYFDSQANEALAQAQVEKSRFFPELSVGYMRQNMLPERGLNAFTVGASFPIFFNSQRSRVRQAKAEARIAQNDARANVMAMEYKIAEIQTQLRCHQENIRYYNSSALPEAEMLMQSAELQLKSENTPVSEFIHSLGSVFDIRRAYAESVYQYNIAVLEYELYR